MRDPAAREALAAEAGVPVDQVLLWDVVNAPEPPQAVKEALQVRYGGWWRLARWR